MLKMQNIPMFTDKLSTQLVNFVRPYYNQQHRVYHDIEHVIFMFMVAEYLELKLRVSEKLAIAFHDAVWVIGNDPCSVFLSAELLRSVYEMNPTGFNDIGVDVGDVLVACEIIKDTEKHEIKHTPHSGRVIDLDLCGFALDNESFVEMNRRIERECAVFGPELTNTGRTAFMLKMYQREPFFLTEDFDKKSFRDQVIANILSELKYIKEKQ